jgi:hypothetical protein
VASAARPGEDNTIPAMVSPLTGKAMAAEVPKDGTHKAVTPASLGDRLSRVEKAGARQE